MPAPAGDIYCARRMREQLAERAMARRRTGFAVLVVALAVGSVLNLLRVCGAFA